MKSFFLNENWWSTFELFNFDHLVCLLITIICFVLIIIYKKKICNISNKNRKYIRIIIVTILLLNFFLYRGAYFIFGKFTYTYHLPLAYCYIVGFLFSIALIRNSKKLYRIVYPMMFMGPLLAIIFPMILLGPKNYVFFYIFFSHNFLFLANFFIFRMFKLKLTKNDLILSFLITNLIFFSTYFFNYLFNTKYNIPDELFFVFLTKFKLPNINYYLLLEIIALVGIAISLLSTYKFKSK